MYQTRYEGIQIVYLYKCLNGHSYWIVPKNSDLPISNNNISSNNTSSSSYPSNTQIIGSIFKELNKREDRKKKERQRKEELKVQKDILNMHYASLRQQELIALAKMTSKEKEEYYRLKNGAAQKNTDEIIEKPVTLEKKVYKKESQKTSDKDFYVTKDDEPSIIERFFALSICSGCCYLVYYLFFILQPI